MMTNPNTPEFEKLERILERFLLEGRRNPEGYEQPLNEARKSLKQSMRLMCWEVIGDYSCPYPGSCKGDKFNGICLGKEVLTKEQKQRLDQALTKYFGEE